MDSAYAKVSVTILWALGVAVLGLAAGSQSLSAWIALVGAAIIPPLVVLRFWMTPPQTMSERIASGRRR